VAAEERVVYYGGWLWNTLMDVAWLILDSLSFRATPFAEDGPDTMPGLATVAAESGVVFANAYAPGPLSPSSHAAMFTGKLPSAAGMHEAHPYFDTNLPTIAKGIGETHRTHLVSLNAWLSQGLQTNFETFEDFSRQYLVSHNGTDPLTYFRKHDPEGSFVRRLAKFAFHDGKPVRSLANYLSYRFSDGSLVPQRWGDEENYQYADRINERIRTLLDAKDDHFIVANYMDIHPPFDASEAALERFASDIPTEELPVNVSPERHIPNEKKSYDPAHMEKLYRAAVWDVDRKVTPLIRELIADGTFVIVTSDHGIWNCDTAYAENRLHVPLVMFHPDEPARTVDWTVNLRSLPRTTMEATEGTDGGFAGHDLLSTTDHTLSITEVIHHPNEVYEDTGRVDVTKAVDRTDSIQRDLVLVDGNARADCIRGEWSMVRGEESDLERLREAGEDVLQTPVIGNEFDGVSHDAVTRKRLADLGYL
jgi:arylsulfatase A-like enzyme